MPTKHRSKEQKIKAQQHRQQEVSLLYQYTDASTPTIMNAPAVSEHSHVPAHSFTRELFAYDVKLIYRDLLKTIVITVAILISLGALYLYLPK